MIDYKYSNEEGGVSLELFLNNQKISNNTKKNLVPKTELKYSSYTRHFTDSTNSTQIQLDQYKNQMLAQNKDTLHIGTVSEFKAKHPILFEKLTKNDSISVRLLEDGKLGKRITVPVKW